ncbi:M28 family metallopeptidase [Chitinimonas sp. BJB300]|uniref:M28 family metallopeptidase n=1 Tax=Chitinimonas sp. BJB300 TaxID=1559339 RepID=UPI000C11D66E|nr:M28 family metallopeptidase [Chitinimonas sp. BJB300]PHV10396.1 leucyl aminopeptidase [Chitinimonas sp. BJB300]TSJ83837.1 M20/M25/M40 family metallo-hydrolase [Chitinimonas sp. BJB300]
MQYKLLTLLLAGAFMFSPAQAAPKKIWITVGDAAYAQLQKLAPEVVASESQVMAGSVGNNPSALANPEASKLERAHVVEVDESLLFGLSEAVHHELNRCGGFMAHSSKEEALAALQAPATLLESSRPSYTIDNQATVNPLLPQMQDSNIADTIASLSAFTNRYYTTTHGVNASNWLMQRWQQLAGGRTDVTVEQFTHSAYPQKSVILTIKGTDNANEVVVLGGHLDSINGSGTTENTRAPGADDDASGIASLTEALRVMLASGYKPRRTIKFMGYAAEERGLLGSQDIAKKFKADNINVVGVMQLDMTNYKGSANDIYIYTDYTDSQQNTFVTNLITTYLPTLTIGTDRCGYGCSDHASWYNQGYLTSMPFEASFNQDNPNIHTVNDTYANMGNQAQHALKFSRLGLAFAVELGSDGAAVPPPGDKVETFTGNLGKGQKMNLGPFKVGAGGKFLADMTGTGDADLYVRKGSAPTTSSYDCRPYKNGSTESCTLNLTANGDVYVMLNGYATASYNLKVTYRTQ